ncbi:D-glycerate dehydrogenase [Bacillus sp. MRMR6]|uniref:2-hydroxyacid dehydrogenase n=1 Tax=Bacillus sp. MRMR6 TaxID=1928617 RepID=UPI0009524B3E|nr:D-glycerate dehydrogenase [Bacillus sp. MRMR6]OLS41050.1 D-glycerate dehydrogenase [Bacillus sp. MRMR6]
MKPKIYITRKLPDEIVAMLEEYCRVTMWQEEGQPVPYEILEREIESVDALFCLLTDRIDAKLIDKAKILKVISTMAVGYNHIDIQAATDQKIIVTNTPGVLTETTADLTFALLMAASRRLVEASDFLRKGQWKTWSPMQLSGQDIFGATLGIIGFGNIGQAVARRANGFNMNVIYYNRSRKEEAEKELGATYKDLETLLTESDFVCLLTPFTKETKHLIDRNEIALMKKTAILINTSRGEVVNEEALFDALKNEQIWAAGLDVFQQEPVPLQHPLLTLPNVVTLPHIGSASVKTRLAMARLAAQQLIEGLQGAMPENTVNPMAYKKESDH